MNKNMALISSLLLLFSTQVLADRPSMNDQDTWLEAQKPPPLGTTSEMPGSAETTTETPTEAATIEEPPVTETMDSENRFQAEETQIEETQTEEKVSETPATQTTMQSTTQTGDVLELQSGETLPVHTLDFPHRGMTMDNVQKELGEPLEMSPPVGDPPISSWSYSDRTVYFEHSKVIHAVSNR